MSRASASNSSPSRWWGIPAVFCILIGAAAAVPGEKSRPLSPGDIKHRSNKTEAELLEQLRKDTPEVDVRKEDGFTKSLLDAVTQDLKRNERLDQGDKPVRGNPTLTLAMLQRRADLKGLPFSARSDCQLREQQAKILQQVSQSIRDAMGHAFRKSEEPVNLRGRVEDEAGVIKALDSTARLYSKVRFPYLVQAFGPQGPRVRQRLIELLADWNDEESSRLLARIAVFDLSPDVRVRAIEALKKRRLEQSRDVFLKGLRYPWPPAADHAAEALVTLDDRAALPELVKLLDMPDPAAPFLDSDKRWAVHELVQVNHMRNCMLCHAPSVSESDFVRGAVPAIDKPLPRDSYEDACGEFIRADVTYLRQDFSVFHAAAHPDPWPEVQRFDYLVRVRELSDEEQTKRGLKSRRGSVETTSYPQREAVLFALRELHGKDVGDSSSAWKKAIGDAKSRGDLRPIQGK
jgi:hypothetical protein